MVSFNNTGNTTRLWGEEGDDNGIIAPKFANTLALKPASKYSTLRQIVKSVEPHEIENYAKNPPFSLRKTFTELKPLTIMPPQPIAGYLITLPANVIVETNIITNTKGEERTAVSITDPDSEETKIVVVPTTDFQEVREYFKRLGSTNRRNTTQLDNDEDY